MTLQNDCIYGHMYKVYADMRGRILSNLFAMIIAMGFGVAFYINKPLQIIFNNKGVQIISP